MSRWTRLCYKFNRNHTARAERYWEIINRPKIPPHILDQLYVTGGNGVVFVQGGINGKAFKGAHVCTGDIFTIKLSDTESYLFTHEDLVELVSA